MDRSLTRLQQRVLREQLQRVLVAQLELQRGPGERLEQVPLAVLQQELEAWVLESLQRVLLELRVPLARQGLLILGRRLAERLRAPELQLLHHLQQLQVLRPPRWSRPLGQVFAVRLQPQG